MIMAEGVQSHVVQGQGHGPRNIEWVLRDELEELLDVLRAALIEGRVVDVHHDLLKVVVFLLPL